MTPTDIFVLLCGTGLIAAIAIYFFGPKGKGTTAKVTSGHQSVDIIVDGAYSPSEIKLKVGIPAKVVFDRRDHGDCTEWVIFSDLPTKEGGEIKARLPEDKKTVVEFTPTKPGSYGFVCGMGMVHGKLLITS